MVAQPRAWLAIVLSCSTGGIASAQQTKTFPEAECSYTLPGNEWEWLDTSTAPRSNAKTICFAQSTNGLRFAIRFDRILEGELTGSKGFESFEVGILSSGRMKKLRSKELTFKGVLCFQIDLVDPAGHESSTRVMYANDRYYNLQVVNANGPLGPDSDTVFDGFSFVGQPRSSPDASAKKEDVNFERGKEAGGFISAILIVLFIVGIIALVVYLSRSHSRSDELNEDYHDRR